MGWVTQACIVMMRTLTRAWSERDKKGRETGKQAGAKIRRKGEVK